MKATQASDEERDRPQQRAEPAEREPVGGGGADRSSLVDLDERTRGRGLHEPEAEERQGGADHQREGGEHPGALAGDDTEEVDRADTSHCRKVIATANGNRSRPIPRKRRARWRYMRSRGRDDLPPNRRRRETERSDGSPGRAHRREDDQGEESADHEQRQRRDCGAGARALRSPGDAAAAEVGGAVPRRPPAGTV